MTDKYINAAKLISTISDVIPEFSSSPSSGFRSRCEFGYRDNHYTMVENGKKVFLRFFEFVCLSIINELLV